MSLGSEGTDRVQREEIEDKTPDSYKEGREKRGRESKRFQSEGGKLGQASKTKGTELT